MPLNVLLFGIGLPRVVKKGRIYNMPTPTVVATPAIDLLLLLQQYNQLRRIADENIRSSIWNITKARRSASSSSLSSTGNSAYLVNDVREELVATAVLEYTAPVVAGKDEDDDEERLPNLVADPSDGIDNNDDNDKVIVCGEGGEFVLHFDRMEALLKQQQLQLVQQQQKNQQKNLFIDDERDVGDTTTLSPLDDVSNNTNINEGLRQRQRGEQKNKDKEDTTRSSEWITESDHSNEEDILPSTSIVDPIQLFGLTPPALRVAQSRCRLALGYYIEVANLITQMNTIMNK
jgi:hypothetical protein